MANAAIKHFLSFKGNRGLTVLETLIAVGMLSLVLLATLSLLVTMLNVWQKGSSGTTSNMYAGLAMRRLVLDMQEGRSAYVSGGRLVVSFPLFSGGQYVKGVPGATVVYYRSGPTGSETSGYYLWKSVGVTKTRLGKNIESLVFSVDSGNLVRVEMKGRDPDNGAVDPRTIQMSVKLRNG